MQRVHTLCLRLQYMQYSDAAPFFAKCSRKNHTVSTPEVVRCDETIERIRTHCNFKYCPRRTRRNATIPLEQAT